LVAPERRLTLLQESLYGAGHLGISLVHDVVMAWVVFFYREGPHGPLAPTALVGLALAVGSLVNAAVDPWVGHWSDRIRSPRGRRRPFIFWGTPPMCLTFVLLFTPLRHTLSPLNVVYLLVVNTAFFFFFTLAVCPYLALLPELAPERLARIRLATIQAFFSVAGVVLAVFAGLVIERLGFLAMALLCAAITALTMYLPLLGPQEQPQPAAQMPLPFLRALRETFANRHFRYYIGAYLCFWFGLRMMMVTLPFYVTQVLGMKVGGFTLVQGVAIAVAVLCFPLVARLAARYGKRLVLLGAFLIFALTVPLLGVAPYLASGTHLIWGTLLILALVGPAIAVFFTLPNAIVGDLADFDEQRTGLRREGIYFGIQGFLVKVVLGVGAYGATLGMSIFGHTRSDPGGILLIPLVCGVIGLAATFVFRGYRLP